MEVEPRQNRGGGAAVAEPRLQSRSGGGVAVAENRSGGAVVAQLGRREIATSQRRRWRNRHAVASAERDCHAVSAAVVQSPRRRSHRGAIAMPSRQPFRDRQRRRGGRGAIATLS